MLINLCDDIATFSAVAAIGAAFGHMLLATKAYATISASSCVDADFRSIYEHGLNTPVNSEMLVNARTVVAGRIGGQREMAMSETKQTLDEDRGFG